jgi:uncharacterized protein (TIGR02246 family)
MRRLTLSVLSLAFLAACQPATTELTEEQKAAIAAEVDSVVSQWWAAWNAMDFDHGMSFFEDAGETAWAGDGQLHYSVSGIDGYYRPLFAGLQRQDITSISSRTIVLAPDVVYTIRNVNVAQVDTAGIAQPEFPYAETIIWVKQNGEWKVLVGHGSTPSESM